MAYELKGRVIEADKEGYLTDGSSWDTELALLIAEAEGVDMNDDRWAVVRLLRHYYEQYGIEPAMRVLIRAIGKTLGPEKGNSRYLYELFPDGPIRQASKIAGLPKPTSCT